METFGDLRAVTAVWLEDRAGMREFDASALSKVIAEAQHAPYQAQPDAHGDGQENTSGEVNPVGGPGEGPEVDQPKVDSSGSETQSEGKTEVSAALTEVASVLLEGQRALIEASRRTTQGKVETLKKEDGPLPTVKVTKAWLRKVGEQLRDVEVKQLPPRCATGHRFTGQGGHRPLPCRWDTRPYCAYHKTDLVFGIPLH